MLTHSSYSASPSQWRISIASALDIQTVQVVVADLDRLQRGHIGKRRLLFHEIMIDLDFLGFDENRFPIDLALADFRGWRAASPSGRRKAGLLVLNVEHFDTFWIFL